ncbi:MAG TPA: hypothetical protein VGY99_28245 [Candidatus Binataceae bacterium]|jgi:hypothetical protein|nr:hypothetical protein [Candidatus Binataceae bacterium]
MATGDINKVWSEGAKRTLETYVNGGEQLARVLLDLHEQSTSWARETVFAPLFEAQRTAGKQILDNSLAITRRLYNIDNHSAAKS